MKKILFVCLGNICRSPLAMALFNKHVKEQGFEHLFVSDSCGTADYHIGNKPDRRSVENARSNGLTYTHTGRQLSSKDFETFDYILAMDDSNYRTIQSRNSSGHPNVFKLRDFDSVDKGADVPDPYFGGPRGFQEVYEILDRATLHLLEELTEPNHGKNS